MRKRRRLPVGPNLNKDFGRAGRAHTFTERTKSIVLGAMHPGGPVVRIHLRGVSRESIAFLSVTEVAHIRI